MRIALFTFLLITSVLGSCSGNSDSKSIKQTSDTLAEPAKQDMSVTKNTAPDVHNPPKKSPIINSSRFTAPAAPIDSQIISTTAEKAVQSVVFISSQKNYGFPMGGYGTRRRGGARPHSTGSGVIIKADGTIITNHHVIAGASEITVRLFNDKKFKAKIIGSDPRTDIAVIKLANPPDNLKPMTFADTSRIRLGEIVLAIGNPFGLGGSVTMGIVSAKGRANVGIVEYEDFIQTDAAINPGNSGGALVNLRGELIGINTAILSKTGGYQGIGFAIPSEMAETVMKNLIRNGHFTRGYLGVVIKDLDDRTAKYANLPSSAGAVVMEVGPNSPASAAGLKAGDIILSLDGKPVKNSGVLRNKVAMTKVGKPVVLDVVRTGKTTKITVTIGKNVDDQKPWSFSSPWKRNRGRNNPPSNPRGRGSNPWEDFDDE